MRWGRLGLVGAVLALAIVGPFACSSDEEPGGVCNPGDTRTCVGPGSCNGGQSCNGDGTGWSTCDCGTSTGGGGTGASSAGGGGEGGGCPEGTGDCDDNPDNGCETDTNNSIGHCGGCGYVCEFGPNSYPLCVAGGCELGCDPGYETCDEQATTGCETHIDDDLQNCGACDLACGTTHASPTCAGGVCNLNCEQGYDSCDNDVTTGCETPLDTLTDCAACATPCDLTNATGSCSTGSCALQCDPGFGDCDQLTSTGCEQPLNANPHCGACANECWTTCVNGTCAACDTGLAVDASAPLDAAKAIGLCTGVQSATWVLPDGSPASGSNYALGHGILPDFGPNVNPQEGTRVLALSSGTARRPSDPGYQSPAGYWKSMTAQSPPTGYPKQIVACPNVTHGQPYDGAALELVVNVPSGATGFMVSTKYYTYEWPSYICSVFNDFAVAMLSPIPPGLPDGNIVFDPTTDPLTVNSPFIDVCGCQNGPPCITGGKTYPCSLGAAGLTGTGFENAAATGWLDTAAPVTPNTTITVRFTVWDSGDGYLDATLLVDNWRWVATPNVTVDTQVIPNPL